jgi:cytoskeletal protein CcmA (bactofilin family)
MFEFSKKGTPDEPAEASAHDRPRPAAPESPPRSQGSSLSGARREAAIIGPSIQLDGDLRGQEDLLIEGEVNGTVQLRNNSLTVGGQGKIKANVYAKEIHVDGSVEGDLFGSERVIIRKSAQVRGNITSPRVAIEEGARFKGSIEMDSAAVESALGKTRGATEPARSKPVEPAATATTRSSAAS